MEIYKITNLINNKIYIGKDTTSNPNYYGSGLLIKKSINKYGIENFSKEILEKIDSDDHDYLSKREKYWIKYYDSTNLEIGYNISAGGDGGDTLRNHPNKEMICEKISKGSPKKGKTYEEVFGEEYAKEYKRKLSESHPRLSMKELTGEYYETWLKNVRKVAESKRGKSIKENNNWTEEQYQEYLKNLSIRNKNNWNKISSENKEKIKNSNKKRGIRRRIDNINDFKYKFNEGDINRHNYQKYKYKIWYWIRDLSKEEFNELLPENFMISFYNKVNEFKKENRKNRNEFKHSVKPKQKKITKKDKFIDFFNNLKDVIDENNLKNLEEYYSNEESLKIRKKLLRSKFRELISLNYIDVIKKSKVIEEKKTDTSKFYGNSSKKINIYGIEYDSVSKASKTLNINRGTIRYRLKSNKYSDYNYSN